MADPEEPTEMLATRRSKRSTAGNRMEAALAEMALEDANKDLDDDKEFFVENDEQDEFGSDFESTDEEAEKVVEAGGETEVVEEERRVRKAARSKLERMTAAAHARQRDTFNPELQLKDKERTSMKRTRTRASVKLGDAVDAETGEVVVANDAPVVQGKKRMSKRKHTVMNTSATATRLKETQQRKATGSKRHKTEHKVWTQAELIAQALDTEEGNIKEHRDYLKNESEKRKKARVTRTKIEGPLLRWKSRLEEITVVVPPPPPPPPVPAPAPTPPTTSRVPSFTPTVTGMPNLAAYRSVYGGYGGTFTPTNYTFTTGVNGVTSSVAASTPSVTNFVSQSGTRQPFTQFQHYQPPNASVTSPFPMWPPAASTSQNHQPYYSLTGATTTASVSASATATLTTAATTTPIASAPTGTSSTAVPSASPAVASTTPSTPAPAPTPTSAPTPTPALAPTPTATTVSPVPVSTVTPSTTPSLPISTTAVTAPTVQAVSTTTPAETSVAPSTTAASEEKADATHVDDKPKEPETKKETVTKNYVIHELVQQKSGPKPSWTSTMGAMFGDHVKWDEIKVYSGKNRPLSRPRQTCPITGQQAHYFDPRTGVPYANSRAYKILTRLIRHEYVWDPSLGCYTGHQPIDQPPPESSPASATL
ncbi:hypothetical protein CVT24_003470 [Panaeolus cyanescens]|uniref:Vps72/YL1 C-terminal domain-containing protein n=1 Tax=Panaeolus cyanescens TaxID=181874 RepID=A0A409Y7N8_9AGAR|nr:hypothetical protein CVT24_003470 [Panaeolus cyanescens]